MDEEGRSRVPSSYPSLSGFFVREMERAGRRGVIKLCYVEWEKKVLAFGIFGHSSRNAQFTE